MPRWKQEWRQSGWQQSVAVRFHVTANTTKSTGCRRHHFLNGRRRPGSDGRTSVISIPMIQSERSRRWTTSLILCKMKISWSFFHSLRTFEAQKKTDDTKQSHFPLWEAVTPEGNRRNLRWRSKNKGPRPHQGHQSVYISYLKKKGKRLKCQHNKQPPCHRNDCY